MSLYSQEGGYNVTTEGSDNMATGQVTVATTATQIVAARTGRSSVTIVNDGTVDVFLGGSTVTTTTGELLAGVKGQTLTLNTSAAVYGIVATGTETVTYVENY